MNLAVDIVFKTATARRPKISMSELKARGGEKGDYRVSDPNAVLGVPVKSGALQASIKKSVKWQGKKITGEIDAGGNLPYAMAMEFGTSSISPRPFMRPAWNENKEFIQNKFKEKIDKL
jgi:HK97 gp10 family phage protein